MQSFWKRSGAVTPCLMALLTLSLMGCSVTASSRNIVRQSIEEVCLKDPQLKSLTREQKLAIAKNNATAMFSCKDGMNNK